STGLETQPGDRARGIDRLRAEHRLKPTAGDTEDRIQYAARVVARHRELGAERTGGAAAAVHLQAGDHDVTVALDGDALRAVELLPAEIRLHKPVLAERLVQRAVGVEPAQGEVPVALTDDDASTADIDGDVGGAEAADERARLHHTTATEARI